MGSGSLILRKKVAGLAFLISDYINGPGEIISIERCFEAPPTFRYQIKKGQIAKNNNEGETRNIWWFRRDNKKFKT